MKKISIILLSASFAFASGVNHGGKCKKNEVLLRSGTCVTDCGAYESKQKRIACVKNQLGPGEHNYYAELPSDCIECVMNRKILEASKKSPFEKRGRKNGSSK